MGVLFQHPTVGLAEALRQTEAAAPRWSHVVPICAEGNLAPLYLLPGAVGSVLYLQPHGPYHLAGHSSGGRVAFEMARQLEQFGETVAWVAILDTGAPDPDQPPWAQPQTDQEWLDQLVQVFEELGGVDLQIGVGELAVRGDTEAAYARVLQALQRQELVFTASDTVQALRYWVQAYRATVGRHADDRCTQQSLRCAIHLLRASERAGPARGRRPGRMDGATGLGLGAADAGRCQRLGGAGHAHFHDDASACTHTRSAVAGAVGWYTMRHESMRNRGGHTEAR